MRWLWRCGLTLTVFVFQSLSQMSCCHGSVMSSLRIMQHLCFSISVAPLFKSLHFVYHTASHNRPFTFWWRVRQGLPSSSLKCPMLARCDPCREAWPCQRATAQGSCRWQNEETRRNVKTRLDSPTAGYIHSYMTRDNIDNNSNKRAIVIANTMGHMTRINQ